MTSFEGNLLTLIKNSDVFEFAGKYSRNAKNTSIQLCSGPDVDADIPLEIDLDLIKNEASLTSHEYKKKCSFPDQIDLGNNLTDFKVCIKTFDNKLDITVNDKPEPECSFDTEVSPKKIKSIKIKGNVKEIFRVAHRHAQEDRPVRPQTQEENLRYNFSTDFPPLHPNDKVYMKMIPHENFSLFLMSSEQKIISVFGSFIDEREGTIEIKSRDDVSPLKPKFETDKFLEIEFYIGEFSITISIDGEIVGEPLSVKKEMLNNLTRIEVEKSAKVSLEVCELLFNCTDEDNE